MRRGSPATKPERSPAALDRFDSEWNTTTWSNPCAERRAGFERARRRRLVVDLGIALVDRQHEIVAARASVIACFR